MSTGIIVLPVLTAAFGIRDAIPIVTIAMLVNTLARTAANYSYIDFRVVLWYTIGAVPSAAFGAAIFAVAPTQILARGLGAFLIGLVIYRHAPFRQASPIPLRGFTAVGIGQGFFSALFGGAGPFGAHFFLSYGLSKNAFVGTVALGTIFVSATKTIAYGGLSLLDWDSVSIGLLIGVIMALGAMIGAQLVRKLPEQVFGTLVELVMIISGIWLVFFG